MNWYKKTLTLACASALALGMAVTSIAQDKIDLVFADASLAPALQFLSQKTGIKFIIAEPDAKYGGITLSVHDVSPEEAVDMLCTAAGAYAERQPNGVYVIRFGKKSTGPDLTNVPATKIEAPKIVTKLRCRRGDTYAVFQEITGTFPAFPDSRANELKNLNTWTKDKPNPGGVQINFPQAQPINITNGSNGNGGNGIQIPNEGGSQAGAGGFGQPGGGGGNFGGQPGGGQNGGLGGQNTTLQPGTGLVPQGIDYITYDPTDNSLVVRGTDEAIRALQQLVQLFDVAPRQVEIKVEFITTSQSLSKSIGYEWQFARGSVQAGERPGTFARTGDPIFINYSTGNLVTRLRTQLLSGEGKTVNAPSVRTMNNEPASVFQNVTYTIFQQTVTGSAGGNIVTYNPIQIPISTGLSVRPRISDNGYVTMFLLPTVSDLGQVRRSPDGSEVPDTLTQTMSVAVRVKDGDTVVLGGLNRTQTFSNLIKFPVLADLPIIGQFFRSSRTERNDQELLIFVTPHIIKEEDTDFISP